MSTCLVASHKLPSQILVVATHVASHTLVVTKVWQKNMAAVWFAATNIRQKLVATA
jgi:hypothetical protein